MHVPFELAHEGAHRSLFCGMLLLERMAWTESYRLECFTIIEVLPEMMETHGNTNTIQIIPLVLVKIGSGFIFQLDAITSVSPSCIKEANVQRGWKATQLALT